MACHLRDSCSLLWASLGAQQLTSHSTLCAHEAHGTLPRVAGVGHADMCCSLDLPPPPHTPLPDAIPRPTVAGGTQQRVPWRGGGAGPCQGPSVPAARAAQPALGPCPLPLPHAAAGQVRASQQVTPSA